MSTLDEDRRLNWAYLSRAADGPCRPLTQLITDLGVDRAAESVRNNTAPPQVTTALRGRASIEQAARDLQVLRRGGGRLITPDDPEWPHRHLHGFDGSDAGGANRAEHAAPVALWAIGPATFDELLTRSVAVAGSRAMTAYGRRITEELVTDLVHRNVAIVSGAAYGIDATAGRTALVHDGATMAVTATGIDCVYPAGNADLLRDIKHVGLLVTEYPPGTLPAKRRFTERGRLIAALSNTIVAVEAGIRSGTINTIHWANRLSRPAHAMPGSVLSAASTGCHNLIRGHEAELITTYRDLLPAAEQPPNPEPS